YTVPAGTVRSTPSTARVSPKVLTRPTVSIAGPDDCVLMLRVLPRAWATHGQTFTVAQTHRSRTWIFRRPSRGPALPRSRGYRPFHACDHDSRTRWARGAGVGRGARSGGRRGRGPGRGGGRGRQPGRHPPAAGLLQPAAGRVPLPRPRMLRTDQRAR